MSIHPLMTILYGDILKFTYSTPFAVYGGDNPFPRGRILLVVARGLCAGLQLGSFGPCLGAPRGHADPKTTWPPRQPST